MSCVGETRFGRKRGGGLNQKGPPAPRDTKGYLTVRLPDHPISKGDGNVPVYVHRVIFFNAHGGGPFECHWCGVSLLWEQMQVDHLNFIPTDNKVPI